MSLTLKNGANGVHLFLTFNELDGLKFNTVVDGLRSRRQHNHSRRKISNWDLPLPMEGNVFGSEPSQVSPLSPPGLWGIAGSRIMVWVSARGTSAPKSSAFRSRRTFSTAAFPFRSTVEGVSGFVRGVMDGPRCWKASRWTWTRIMTGRGVQQNLRVQPSRRQAFSVCPLFAILVSDSTSRFFEAHLVRLFG
ncbi:hypothetical protein N657DRAFT_6728 [Parathielavia appendiculata]|uniref:Uncharacterized protein n=1 Tax=Parathielavia appendiculata TaxID=2587402 RepID=A0AAN6Z862_9PEZI|nr:hypothetical protein N657DRAFT_6728 [Parathielavia appendiculata]